MAEKISPETRSRMMSGIRGRDTKPERVIRSFLHAEGFRFRVCPKDLPGKPDIVLPRWQVAIFAHGCFWHGHAGCGYFRLPKTRAEFWASKIAANATRDAAASQALADLGWRVAIVWECALRDDAENSLNRLAAFISSTDRMIEIGSRSY